MADGFNWSRMAFSQIVYSNKSHQILSFQMYFSIPETSEILIKKNSTPQPYTLFHIHINGIHHCSLRYSQLRQFHDELHRLHPELMRNIQTFPPKKLFTLSVCETNERRLLLERFIQSIVQNRSLISSSYVNHFFLTAQRETLLNQSNEKNFPEKISLTILFLNQDETIIDNLSPEDSTNIVYNACLQKIPIEQEYASYFGLFFYEQMNIIRPLFALESPYFSFIQMKRTHPNVCLILKRSYWDLSYDLKFLDHPRLSRLVSIQAQHDIEQSKDLFPSDIYEQLDHFNAQQALKDYIQLARTSKFYGYILLRNCSISDLTTDRLAHCLLAIGNNELICYIYDEQMKIFLKEINFKVTRLRCWKVNWTKEDLNIAFEYLMRKDVLQWLTIHSEQAPLISTCLQGMIDEILAKKSGTTNPVSIFDVPQQRTTMNNGLTTRTQSDLNRLNNNKIFDEGGGDDDL